MKKIILATSMFVLLAGCQNMKPAETDNTKTFYIDSSLADCMGVAPMKCIESERKPK
ncbi:lipoprotein [Providencia hangzhouensis]|uniref:lipoprotein n=1 Tax=Providencia hangzhouensis TaxID=3031799 RepID=UPI003F68E3CB